MDFTKYNFNPSELLKMLVQVYLNFGQVDGFCQALAKDERSYSSEVYNQTIELLQ